MKKANNMLYGANEATTLDSSKAAVVFEGLEKYESTNLLKKLLATDAVRFGRGAWVSADDAVDGVETLSHIAGLATDDNKIRLVYDVDKTQSGVVMSGNHVASSKILDITVNGNDGYTKSETYDATGEAIWNANGKFERATQVTVKWFGFGHSNRDAAGEPLTSATLTDTMGIHTTSFEIVNPDAIQKMLEDMQERVENLEAYVADTDNLKAATGTALTVTPKTSTKTVKDIDGNDVEEVFASWEVGVNVDDDTVKIITEDDKDVLKVATYDLVKLGGAKAQAFDVDGNILPEQDDDYASQYQMVMTAPDGTKVALGDTIDIFKDFLLKEAHVCTFNYARAEADAEIPFNGSTVTFVGLNGVGSDSLAVAADLIGTTVDNNTYLPWAKLDNGTYEYAVKGKGIKWGHTYLHLVLNTVNNDEHENVLDNGAVAADGKNQLTTDVFLDFTDIFHTFSADEKYIHLNNTIGKFSLDEDAVAEMANELIEKNHIQNAEYATLSDHIIAVDASIAALETSVNNIEASYVKVSELTAPSDTNEQFNTVTITNTKRVADGAGWKMEDEKVIFDIPNQTFYQALNSALENLKGNDVALATLLTWEGLD